MGAGVAAKVAEFVGSLTFVGTCYMDTPRGRNLPMFYIMVAGSMCCDHQNYAIFFDGPDEMKMDDGRRHFWTIF